VSPNLGIHALAEFIGADDFLAENAAVEKVVGSEKCHGIEASVTDKVDTKQGRQK